MKKLWARRAPIVIFTAVQAFNFHSKIKTKIVEDGVRETEAFLYGVQYRDWENYE